jgi:hypothetical protein
MNSNETVESLTRKFVSMTSATIHTDAKCSVNRRRQVGNAPISETQAALVIERPELFKFCTKCN